MKYASLVLILTLAACEAGPRYPMEPEKPEPTPEEKRIAREVRSTFEAFVKAMIEGDSEVGYFMLSAAYKSEWLFARAQAPDAIFRDWQAGLKGNAKVDYELWYGFCMKHRTRLQRAESLPRTVVNLKSLLDLWNAYFEQDKMALKVQMGRVKVESVAVDPTGVTVTVRNGTGRMELYAMKFENDGWKIDGHSAGSQR